MRALNELDCAILDVLRGKQNGKGMSAPDVHDKLDDTVRPFHHNVTAMAITALCGHFGKPRLLERDPKKRKPRFLRIDRADFQLKAVA